MKKVTITGIIILILIILIGSYYFLFVHISLKDAERIITNDFKENKETICDRFFVNDDNCEELVNCYSIKTLNALEPDFKKAFARDIKLGKSNSFDTYRLVNGKELGEECLADLLDIPEGIDLDLIGNEPIGNTKPNECTNQGGNVCNSVCEGESNFTGGVFCCFGTCRE